MRNFSWTYFTMTGNVESFLLYKEMDQFPRTEELGAFAGVDDEPAAVAGAADDSGSL
ncbi:YqzL family protein [Paenibacillus beijingensis]|uniref:YqzL family protein n=1 Tax=Paenibacillus beijingensis TaxID=1126833 RepID=UPI0009E61BB1|nr:YqzL family protein [Paenibacillus beijingensis]